MSVGPISGVRLPLSPAVSSSAPTGQGAAAFGEVVRDVLAREATASQAASQAIQSLVQGRTDNLHAVTLAVAQADLQFRLILELRNRLTEVYQEVMRMQI
jgi:flagellar hook-basal body complex protein FliE